MSTATDLQELLDISNPHNIATRYRLAHPGQTPPFIIYRRNDDQARLYAAWQVIRPGYRTDDGPVENRYWRNNGNKTFDVNGPSRDRAIELDAAKAWASERYSVAEWVKTPVTLGAWFPKPVADWATAALAEARKNQATS